LLPHLTSAIIPRCDCLWEKYLRGECPKWIYVSSDKSFMYNANSGPYIPYVNLDPDYRRLDASRIEIDFADECGFLVIID